MAAQGSRQDQHGGDSDSNIQKYQKDTDARWTQKRGKNYFGYKDHIEVDVQHKIIRDYKITDASVHDSKMFMLTVLIVPQSMRRI